MRVETCHRRTFYVIQAFTRDRQGVRMDPPIEALSEASAVRMAERMAPRKASVVVLARTGCPETGEFDEPEVLQTFGEMAEDDLRF